MKLRNKIILFFSITFLVVLGFAVLTVYFSMAGYREAEFAQRLKEKTTTTYRLLIDFREIEHDLLQVLDETTINNLYDEKILLFDADGKLIYSSVDDTAILFPLQILKRLQAGEEEIYYTEGSYDVLAHVIRDKGKIFYAIGKANDRYGKEKLNVLGAILLGVFLVALALGVLIAVYLSRQISNPIVKLTHDVNSRDINNLSRVVTPSTGDEIASLAAGFNNMLARVEQAYSYQKNLIHHISHELKTPIAVLISNLERLQADNNPEQWKSHLEFQKNGLMQMASVISTLLSISKYESSNNHEFAESVRVDELLFESFESLYQLNSKAKMDLYIHDSVRDADELLSPGHERMLNIAFLNILKNAIEYSDDQQVRVEIEKKDSKIAISIINNGPTISDKERVDLFTYFFRGHNSRLKSGIGLGLVMASKIIQLHKGAIAYSVTAENLNCFTVTLPVALR
jgi:signal transduction histidine kinase